MPNLAGLVDPSQGFSTPLIVATQPNATASAATISPSDTVYVSVGVTSLGTALPPTQSFNLDFYLDGIRFYTQAITPGTDTDWIVKDLKINPLLFSPLNVTPLGHTISVRIDAEDDVPGESSESDNLFSWHFVVKAPAATH